MKISLRILLINFAIVVLIIGSSAVAFYSIMYSVLTAQQSKYLLNSANDFIYAYQDLSQNTDEDFIDLFNQGISKVFVSEELNEKNIDFIFRESENRVISNKIYKDFVFTPEEDFTIEKFYESNPYAAVKVFRDVNGETFYYGIVLSTDRLNSISQKIGADVTLIINGHPSEISNESSNKQFYHALSNAYSDLSSKEKFEVFAGESESQDIIATICKPSSVSDLNDLASFMVFTTLSEAATLRSSLKYILIIIGSAGVLLSLILTYVFTDKIRKNISQLSKATEITKDGSFKNKLNIKSKDELGQLAGAFNSMVDEIEKNQRAKTEYSEFITLINQNPSLQKIGEAALSKIIKTCGFTVGAIYSYEEEKINLIASHGIRKNFKSSDDVALFESAVKTKEPVEIKFEKKAPEIITGIMQFELKYLIIIPIIYNSKVIAILELGSADNPTAEAKEYLLKIQEQLAIGLTNAFAFVQMENLVKELKKLNEDYQKQNLQILQQNETLVELHNRLKEKADELEIEKQKAEESTNLKSQFLASMSHELRTPMNSILGLTELILEETTLKGKNRERLEVVLKSGRRLMSLINDILDLSKIEAGKMTVNEEEVMLDELIREVEQTISPLTIGKPIDFKIIKHANTKIIINTDRGRVTQVLINLLGNAVKFTEKGFVELHIHSFDNSIKFEVADSGIGISENNVRNVFEEFRQIDGSTTRKYGGTGLGLTICKKIAELLNGSISVKSELGKGSVFSFTIPLKFVRTEDPEIGLNVNIETLIKNRKNPILVIDDDPEIRYTIGQYLISKGYEVEYAEDGEKGIEMAMRLQPFAITLDVMLPKKDGWNILRELKENQLTKDIPVILLSILGDKKLGYGLGAFEYFVKPISASKLLSAFTRLESLAKKRIERIALVDDDEMEYEKFRRAFKDENVKIDFINDSELAFSTILELQPDLIILDLIMPNMDGITLSHKLKANKETKHIPIIISTARDLSDEEKSALHNIVENITIKSNGHPLDVLKVVRDRIHLHEISSGNTPEENNEATYENVNVEDHDDTDSYYEEYVKDENKTYIGEILIVDDDPDTLFTIKEIIESCDYKTKTAKNGKECLEILNSYKPDLILMDIMMPEMDGFQTIKKIREDNELKNLPVIAITAKAMSGDRDVILKHGFDDFVPKPVDATIMAFKIEKLFPKLNIT